MADRAAVMSSMPNMVRCAVVVYCRYPRAGCCKTRLAPILGKDGAARLQLYMADLLLDQLLSWHDANNPEQRFHVELHSVGGTKEELNFWLGKRKKGRPDFSWLRLKEGDDLDCCFQTSFSRLFKQGYEIVVIVGSDIPGMKPRLILEAINKLISGDRTMVLGPAKDGGYTLIGLTKCAAPDLGQLFRDIHWGSDAVYEEQTQIGNQLGFKIQSLSVTLSDVDVPEDLKALEKEGGISIRSIVAPSWAIVVPCLNQAHRLESIVLNILQNAKCLSLASVVFCDGYSDDDTKEKVRQLQERYKNDIEIGFVQAAGGRGVAQNLGASHSSSDCILFLHGDSRLPHHFDFHGLSCLSHPGTVAGCFRFGADIVHVPEKRAAVSWWAFLQMKIIELGTNMRVDLAELPYGDQCLFMRRKIFEKVGKFPSYPLLEDLILVDKLKQIGHVGVADCDPCIVSAKRWQKHGFFKVTLLNQFILLAYWLGVHPTTLVSWYYGSDYVKQMEAKSRRHLHES